MSFAAAQSDAASLAVFGQNSIGSLYAASGNTVTYVTDAELATAGFLDAFDAFVYTRDGEVQLTANGVNSPVVQGVTFPYNPGAVEFGFDQDGFNPAAVVAQFDNGTPAILASGVEDISAVVPEPATWGLMILGFGLVGASTRTRSRRARFAI